VAANRIFIDLETSGLNPRDGHIFEVAVVATTADREYRELAHQTWVVGWDVDDQWLRARLDPAVYAMHAANNLLHEIPFGQPIAEVEEQLAKFVSYFGAPEPGRQPMGGSSPHFDSAWIQIHMPRVARLFSHRSLDASSVRAFFDDCGWKLPKPAEAAHRALPDIRHSIQVLRDAAQFVTR
jgi:oligoribonuclease (3'-5' exoribonuclease)